MQSISKSSTTIAIVALLIIAATIGAGYSYAGPKQKKVIYYGWGTRDTMYVRDHWQEMEKTPLDGAVIAVAIDRSKPTTGDGATANLLGWNLFSRKAFGPEVFQAAQADLKVPKWTKFDSNFLIACISSEPQSRDFNWFDDKRWKIVLNNWTCYAKLAKESGCKGIIFDTEYYGGGNTFDYRDMKPRSDVPFDEMQRKVRQRGRELMRASAKVFPDMEIPMLLMTSYVWYRQTQIPGPFESSHYALMPAFIDGMLEGADKRTRFIDFSEAAYGVTQRQDFMDWYHRAYNKAMEYTTVPELYRSRVSAGLPIWLDCQNGNKTWDKTDFSKNYYSPESLKATLGTALDITDEYVWIYSHYAIFFPSDSIPEAYMNAMREAHPSAR